MAKKKIKIVIVKCVDCGEKRDIQENEVPDGDIPMCEKCFSPMLAVEAKMI